MMRGNSRPGIFQFIRNVFWNPKYEERGQTFPFSTLNELQAFLGGDEETDSGEVITVRKSQQLDTVFANINTISQDVAKTKSPVKQKKDGVNEIQFSNPVQYTLNRQSNRYMSSFHWKYVMTFHVLGWGNGYSAIIRHPNGDIELLPLMPWNVLIHDLNGEIFYEYNTKKFASRDIIHFKMFTEDGIIGISPLMWNAKLMGYKIKQDKYSTRVIGVKPPGFVSGSGTGEQMQNNIDSWTNHMSGDDPKGIPYISGDDVKFNPLMIPPNEGQHLETKQYSDTKICALYRVPLSKIQFTENIKYSNQEQQDIQYAKDALHPIFEMMEQELSLKLFSEANKRSLTPLEIIFNIWGNIRADLKTRTEFYKMLRSTALANGNEIRAEFDWLPMPNGLGEVFMTQGANVNLAHQKDVVLGTPATTQESEEENKEEDG